jgi:hypothetical protein
MREAEGTRLGEKYYITILANHPWHKEMFRKYTANSRAFFSRIFVSLLYI